MEADLLRFYGVDIRDLGRGLTHRRLLVLVQALPVESATARAQLGPLADWDTATQLLAVIANATRDTVWMASADAQSKTPKHRPEPILPPSGEQEPVQPETTTGMLLDFRARTYAKEAG